MFLRERLSRMTAETRESYSVDPETEKKFLMNLNDSLSRKIALSATLVESHFFENIRRRNNKADVAKHWMKENANAR